jgi:hypothetical protein
MALNADDDYFASLGPQSVERFAKFWDPHGEARLINVGVCFDAAIIVGVEVEFGAGLAEFASELGCGEDGD